VVCKEGLGEEEKKEHYEGRGLESVSLWTAGFLKGKVKASGGGLERSSYLIPSVIKVGRFGWGGRI